MGRPKDPIDPVAVEAPKKSVGRPPRDKGEVRGKGRPKKGEIVAKPVVVHDRPDIKPKNEMKYSKSTVENAKKIYRKYQSKYTNPLNVDEKNLSPAARETWKYIYSLREYEGEECFNLREKGLYNSDEVLFAFESFCAFIRGANFMKPFKRIDGETGVMPIVPSQTNLAHWLGITRKSIYRAMMDGPESARTEYKTMLADLLSEGAMMGVYSSSSSIFTLKNLCDWADKPEDRAVQKEDFVPVEEAEKALAELGYTRPRLIESK